MFLKEDEDEVDLYEGLEADNLGTIEKKVEEKKKEVEKVVKPKEQLYERSRKSLYKKLSGAKATYTKKDPCLFLGAPQAIEDIEGGGEQKVEYLLLLNLLYFINDILIRKHCENIGKVKRVVIIEDENYCKSLGMCLVEFYHLDSSQNYVLYLKEKLKAEVRKLDLHIEEQIKKDELYNHGGYLDYNIIDLLKREYAEFFQTSDNVYDALNKSLNMNRHPLFAWFNTSLKDVLNTYVKSELKKKKKGAMKNDYINRKNESNSDTDSDMSTHILDYVSKKNKFLSYNK
ncbi:conserved Plasmodium protein, unknown function [Plasmodium malariae]|uniref:Uncharacterized protein n=1 Tax=Plasmodium malariae TaxID=5858 RepID=A0A1C3L2D9_PLAMA|nr:conserved Plasmodium protein, unknown function [Plasmodium malariae]